MQLRVDQILDAIDDGIWALPEFQRGFVWRRGQIRGFINALYHGWPVGTLLTWDDSTGIKQRGASPSHRKQNGTTQLLLDGQQRVTTLYGVIRGKPPRFFQGDDRVLRGLYFHVEREEFEYHNPVTMDSDPLWISVSDLFISGWVKRRNELRRRTRTATEPNKHGDRLRRLHKISKRKFYVEHIEERDDSSEKVVELFNQINSSGTKLKAGDLALARICRIWPDARKKMNETLDRWRAVGYNFDLNWLLRIINVVMTGRAEFSTFSECSPQELRTGYSNSVRYCDELLRILSYRLGLGSSASLPSPAAFPVLAFHLHKNGSMSLDEERLMLYWLIRAGISGRYSGSSLTTLSQDLRRVKSSGLTGLVADVITDGKEHTLTADFFDVAESRSRAYKLYAIMSHMNGSRDFCTGSTISHHELREGDKLHRHHIFPQKLLKDRQMRRERINAVANLCLITEKSNHSISATPPITYLAEVAKKNPKVLESQWIPANRRLWSIARYDQFLAERRRLMAEAVNEMLEELLYGSGRIVPVGPRRRSKRSVRVTAAKPDFQKLGPKARKAIEVCQKYGLELPQGEDDNYLDDPSELRWPGGLIRGKSKELVFLLYADEDRAAELEDQKTAYVKSYKDFVRQVESVIHIDIDQDRKIGTPPPQPRPKASTPGSSTATAAAGPTKTQLSKPVSKSDRELFHDGGGYRPDYSNDELSEFNEAGLTSLLKDAWGFGVVLSLHDRDAHSTLAKKVLSLQKAAANTGRVRGGYWLSNDRWYLGGYAPNTILKPHDAWKHNYTIEALKLFKKRELLELANKEWRLRLNTQDGAGYGRSRLQLKICEAQRKYKELVLQFGSSVSSYTIRKAIRSNLGNPRIPTSVSKLFPEGDLRPAYSAVVMWQMDWQTLKDLARRASVKTGNADPDEEDTIWCLCLRLEQAQRKTKRSSKSNILPDSEPRDDCDLDELCSLPVGDLERIAKYHHIRVPKTGRTIARDIKLVHKILNKQSKAKRDSANEVVREVRKLIGDGEITARRLQNKNKVPTAILRQLLKDAGVDTGKRQRPGLVRLVLEARDTDG